MTETNLKLSLEKELEKILKQKGIAITERQYGEHIVLASVIDDIQERFTVQDYRTAEENKKSKERRKILKFLKELYGFYGMGFPKKTKFSYDGLSDVQRDFFLGTIPFFRRTSPANIGKIESKNSKKSLFMIYKVFAKEQHDLYAPVADELVENKKIEKETLDFYISDGRFAGSIIIQNKRVNVKNAEESDKKLIKEKIPKALKTEFMYVSSEIDNQEFNSENVCESLGHLFDIVLD